MVERQQSQIGFTSSSIHRADTAALHRADTIIEKLQNNDNSYMKHSDTSIEKGESEEEQVVIKKIERFDSSDEKMPLNNSQFFEKP